MKTIRSSKSNPDKSGFDSNEQYLSHLLHIGDKKKQRRCLMCGTMFNSRSAGNRRCGKCSRLLGLRSYSGYNMGVIHKASTPMVSNDNEYIYINN